MAIAWADQEDTGGQHDTFEWGQTSWQWLLTMTGACANAGAPSKPGKCAAKVANTATAVTAVIAVIVEIVEIVERAASAL